jgi:Fe-S-cluster containining protein
VGTGLNNVLAEITVDPKAMKVTRIDCHEHEVSFRCQRCAIFCCKLGPPKLSKRDVERLKLSGQSLSRFFDEDHMNLRIREDGSCVFLSPDSRNTKHTCGVYNLRPTLCRVYPFQFQKLNEEKYELRLITCCNGLNTDEGVPIDTSFVSGLVKSELPRLIDTNLL